jgi:hypothetical protein
MQDIVPVTDAPKYPLVSLANAIELAEAVRDAGGANADVPKSVIASHLNSSEISGGFLQRIGSARSFGLIEGRGAYHLSEEAKRYFYPAHEADKERAQLVFLGSPVTFNEIIKRFDGSRLPAPSMLANILHREFGVPESWKDRTASAFIKAAQMVGAIDAQNFLRYRARLHNMTKPTLPIEVGPAGYDASTAGSAEPVATPQPLGNSWFFQMEGEFVRVETSPRLSLALWQKLSAYVEVLKPSEGISS